MTSPVAADALAYLRGSAFSSGYHFPLPQKDAAGFFTDRILYLEAACRGKHVLHLGCCDHAPLIQQKLATDRWLHARLTAAATCCLGLDIAADAVELVRTQFGYRNVIHADLSRTVPAELQAGKPWDVLVAGEVIEHLDNPVAFLAGLQSNLRGLCSEVIITVPNAFRLANIQRLYSRTECINSDHRYWFTPYTLAKVLTSAGLIPLRFSFVQNAVPGRPHGLRSLFFQWLLKTHPALREVLIMEASLA